MSNYSADYQRGKDVALIKQYCPVWAEHESFDVRLAISEGAQAKKELVDLRKSLDCLRQLLKG